MLAQVKAARFHRASKKIREQFEASDSKELVLSADHQAIETTAAQTTETEILSVPTTQVAILDELAPETDEEREERERVERVANAAAAGTETKSEDLEQMSDDELAALDRQAESTEPAEKPKRRRRRS